VSDESKNRWARALINLRWKKKSARKHQAEKTRQQWSKIAPDKRQKIMRERRAKGLAKASHLGLPGNASGDDTKTP
jgi:hypothetical protein